MLNLLLMSCLIFATAWAVGALWMMLVEGVYQFLGWWLA